MEHISNRSCVTFENRDNATDKDYVLIDSQVGLGCQAISYFSKGLGEHSLYLEKPGCMVRNEAN